MGTFLYPCLSFFQISKYPVLPVLVNWLIIQYLMVRMYVCVVQKPHQGIRGKVGEVLKWPWLQELMLFKEDALF